MTEEENCTQDHQKGKNLIEEKRNIVICLKLTAMQQTQKRCSFKGEREREREMEKERGEKSLQNCFTAFET